jgi:hypothetical protein
VGDDRWAPPGAAAVAVTVRALRMARMGARGALGRLGHAPRGRPRMEVGHAGGKERGEPRLARPPRLVRPQGERERREGGKEEVSLLFNVFF